ncbi:hypothetical protein PF008_g16668, partial [Phytophthora fragariae]
MLVASRLKTAAALCALLAVAALQPSAVAGQAISMDAPPEGQDDSHDEPAQPADPTPAPEAPTEAPTSDPGPQDTPEQPDYEWYWKHGEASMFSQDSGVFKTFKPND